VLCQAAGEHHSLSSSSGGGVGSCLRERAGHQRKPTLVAVLS